MYNGRVDASDKPHKHSLDGMDIKKERKVDLFFIFIALEMFKGRSLYLLSLNS